LPVPRIRLPRTLQAQFLLALVVVATLPLGLVVLSVASMDRQALAVQSARELTGLARGLTGEIDIYVSETFGNSRAIASLPEIASMEPARQDSLLKELYHHFPEFSHIATFDRSGRLLASSHPNGQPEITAYASFLTAAERGQQGWQIADDLSTGRPSLFIHTPIRDLNRQVVGVLSTIVDLENLSNLVGRVHIGEGGRAFILDSTGRVLMHPDRTVVLERRDYFALGVQMGSSPVGLGTIRYEKDGDAFIAGYAPVPNLRWTVVVERPEIDVLAPAEQSWRIAMMGLIGSAILAIGAAVVLARTLTHPLRSLAQAAQAFGAGDSSTPLPSRGPNGGELGALVDAFRTMRERLAERTRERQRAEETQRFLAEASVLLASSLDYEVTLSSVARMAVPALADWCVIDLQQPDGSLHRVAVVCADPTKEALARALRLRYPPDPSVAAGIPNVLRTGKSELYREIDESWLARAAQDTDHLEILRAIDPKSYVIVPLVAHGRMLGAIMFVAAESGRRYGADDLALAEDLAHRAALAVANALLYREAQEAIRFRDEFLSIAAHELKTPITGLRGFAQLTIRRLDRNGSLDPAQARQALEAIDQQSDKLARLVSQLLDISRIEAGKLAIERSVTDVTRLVAAVVATAQARTAHHTIEVDAPTPVLAAVDPLRLEQVVTNLIDNAIKYSPDGGQIDVAVSRPSPEEMQVSVRDRGLGIDPERRQQIFDRFYQAHADGHFSGMGLGLYICRQIVELHDGHIDVDFPPDGGTRFVVKLPSGLNAMTASSEEVSV
jgi:signal transduction histidine kinase